MENIQKRKKTVFSGIQPSGGITLGNYLGALKNWITMQDEYSCIYSLVDMHAITVRQDPPTLRKNIMNAYALLLACGLDIDKSIFFVQSHVHQHAELAWILNSYTQFGELSRMTQFKDKSVKHADNINAALFTYPSLMAADILLYQADLVPVGADQKQHLELTRDVAERFNGIYSPTFVVPEGYIPKTGARIMSLADPSKKMSKSDENANGYIGMLDNPEDIMRKFKRAVTDSEACVRYAEGKDGINNLMGIYSCVTDKTFAEIEKEFEGIGYGDFKMAVGQAVIEHIEPIQSKYFEYIKDKEFIEKAYRDGAEKASYLAEKTLAKVKRKIGFVQK